MRPMRMMTFLFILFSFGSVIAQIPPNVTTITLSSTTAPTQILIFQSTRFNSALFFTPLYSGKSVCGVYLKVIEGYRIGCDYLSINVFNSSRFTLEGNNTLELTLDAPENTTYQLPDIEAIVRNATLNVCNVPGNSTESKHVWVIEYELRSFREHIYRERGIYLRREPNRYQTLTWAQAANLAPLSTYSFFANQSFTLRFLLVINTKSESDFVGSTGVDGWACGQGVDGVWKWMCGPWKKPAPSYPITFTNWAPNEPLLPNGCMYVASGGLWYARDCTETYALLAFNFLRPACGPMFGYTVIATPYKTVPIPPFTSELQFDVVIGRKASVPILDKIAFAPALIEHASAKGIEVSITDGFRPGLDSLTSTFGNLSGYDVTQTNNSLRIINKDLTIKAPGRYDPQEVLTLIKSLQMSTCGVESTPSNQTWTLRWNVLLSVANRFIRSSGNFFSSTARLSSSSIYEYPQACGGMVPPFLRRLSGASIISLEENTLLAQLKEDAFLCTRGDGTGLWRWQCGVDVGRPVDAFSRWAPGEPSNLSACVVIQPGGLWRTAECNQMFGGVCKTEMNTAAVPYYGTLTLRAVVTKTLSSVNECDPSSAPNPSVNNTSRHNDTNLTTTIPFDSVAQTPAAVVSFILIVSSVAVSADAGPIGSIQGIATLAESECVGAPMRSASSGTRWTLSPLLALTGSDIGPLWASAAAYNIITMIGLFLIHSVLVRGLAHVGCFTSLTHASERLFYPYVGLAVWSMLVHGTTFSAVRHLSTSPVDGWTAVCVVALVFIPVSTAVYSIWWVHRKMVSETVFTYAPYEVNTASAAMWRRWLLPQGQWLPYGPASQYGALFDPYTPNGIRTHTVVTVYSMSTALANSLPASSCLGLMGTLLGLNIVLGLYYGVWRPMRTPALNVIAAGVYIMNGALAVAAIAGVSASFVDGALSAVLGASIAGGVISTVAMVWEFLQPAPVERVVMEPELELEIEMIPKRHPVDLPPDMTL